MIKIEVTGETDNEPVYDNEPMYENTVQISLDNDTSGEVGQSNRGSTESSDRPRVQPAGVPGHDITQCQAYKPLEISSDGTEPVIEMVEMQPSEATEQPSGATEQPSGATEQPSEATEQSKGAAEQPSGATEQPSGTGYSVTQCKAYKLLDISSGTEPAVAVEDVEVDEEEYVVVTN